MRPPWGARRERKARGREERGRGACAGWLEGRGLGGAMGSGCMGRAALSSLLCELLLAVRRKEEKREKRKGREK
jgi:hypothetical protein